MSPIANQTVLITGGSGKVGRHIIERLLQDGWSVAFTTRTPESLDNINRQFSDAAEKGRLTGYRADFELDTSVPELLSALADNSITPAAIINNARSRKNLVVGASGHPTREQWVKEFQVNVVAPYELIVGLAETDESQLRTVINISSMYGVVAVNPNLYENPDHVPPPLYGVCKAALNHLSRELAVRLAGQGIRVNTLTLGGIEGRVDGSFKARYAQHCPAGTMLREEDVSGPVSFLLSEDSSALDGHNLIADGGWTIW